MSWSGMKSFYGLRPPFDIRVAIPFFLNSCLLVVVGTVCVFLLLDGGVNLGTEPFYFFCYVTALLLLSVTFSRATRVSYTIFYWCIL